MTILLCTSVFVGTLVGAILGMKYVIDKATKDVRKK